MELKIINETVLLSILMSPWVMIRICVTSVSFEGLFVFATLENIFPVFLIRVTHSHTPVLRTHSRRSGVLGVGLRACLGEREFGVEAGEWGSWGRSGGG